MGGLYLNIQEFARSQGYNEIPGNGNKRHDVIIQEAIYYVILKSMDIHMSSFWSNYDGICGVIYLPPGLYRLAKPLLLPRGYITVHLRGDGKDQTILYASVSGISIPVKSSAKKNMESVKELINKIQGRLKKNLKDATKKKATARIDYINNQIDYIKKLEKSWDSYNKTGCKKFPKNRALIEWEYDDSLKNKDIAKLKVPWNYHRNHISGLTLKLPENTIHGVKAIHYRVYWKKLNKSKINNKHLERERLSIELKDIRILYFTPLCAERLIDLEGTVYQSCIEDITANGFFPGLRKDRYCYVEKKIGNTYYTLRFERRPYGGTLLGFDSFLVNNPDPPARPKQKSNILDEGTGLVFSTVRRIYISGGAGTLISGRVIWSTIEDCATDGGLVEPYLKLIRSFRTTIRNICTEGRSEKVNVLLRDCIGIVAEDVSVGSPDIFYFVSAPTSNNKNNNFVYAMGFNEGVYKCRLSELFQGQQSRYYTDEGNPKLPQNYRMNEPPSNIQRQLWEKKKIFRHKSVGLELVRTTDTFFRATPVVKGTPKHDLLVKADKESVRNTIDVYLYTLMLKHGIDRAIDICTIV